MSDRKVTMTDIARLSDASPTTVSLVLRDKPGISSETRDRVLAAAQSLGYRNRAIRPNAERSDMRNVAMLLRARSRNQLQQQPGGESILFVGADRVGSAGKSSEAESDLCASPGRRAE